MESILSKEKLYLFLGVFFAVCLLVITAILVDLWDGVHTAKRTNERVHSHKLRVTIAKISEYWRFILIGFLVDCLGIIFSFYILPFVAVLFGAGLIAVEAKSMFEHAHRRKSHTAELPDIVSSIISAVDKKDAQKVLERLNSEGLLPKPN
ncbi:phage holin family protein [uncultured Duncaniella sp.]|uniref:phage holin family protein n=1 Tax=uncultured Duncaniella sp. TaxID=2768039 RepID=UPI0026F3A2DE|nr:phage holin family protein [uncultured Duncaniella sp.]